MNQGLRRAFAGSSQWSILKKDGEIGDGENMYRVGSEGDVVTKRGLTLPTKGRR